jgi:hypothetical protein
MVMRTGIKRGRSLQPVATVLPSSGGGFKDIFTESLLPKTILSPPLDATFANWTTGLMDIEIHVLD